MDDTSYATVGFEDRGIDAALEAIASSGFPDSGVAQP